MKRIFRKIILLALFALSLSTYFLTWVDYKGVQTLNGISILTGNVLLSLFIIVMYTLSILFFEKAPKVLFCTGLSSLSMLFAITFAKFESSGRFANRCLGPYISFTAIILTIAIYLIFTIQKGKIPTSVHNKKS